MMQQLYYVKKRQLEWREMPKPGLRAPTEAIVEPIVAARCDLDVAFLLNNLTPALRIGTALHQLDPQVKDTLGIPAFAGPFPYGHECVARVVETGSEVKNFAKGDGVVVPFQLSCGTCGCCRLKLTAHCETDRSTPVPPWRMYLYGGTLTTGLANVCADLPDILACVASGRLKPELVTPLTADWNDAPAALLDPGTKVVLVKSLANG